jgi:hypothetical protein
MSDQNISKLKLSGVINVLFWSLVLSFFIIKDSELLKWDKEYVMLYAYIFLSIVFLNSLFYYGFRLVLWRFKWGTLVSYLVSNLLVSIIFISNYIFVLIFGKQLGMEGLVMMIRGWQGGELGNFTAVILSIVLGLFLYLVVFFIFFRVLDRYLHNYYLKNRIVILISGILLLMVFFLHSNLIDMAQNSWKMEKLKYKIPWQSVTGFPEEKIRITHDTKEDKKFPELFINPPDLDENVEIKNALSIKDKYKKILELDLKIKNPRNILFINVEGLRYDMLNSENAPNLYKFATSRGKLLKNIIQPETIHPEV